MRGDEALKSLDFLERGLKLPTPARARAEDRLLLRPARSCARASSSSRRAARARRVLLRRGVRDGRRARRGDARSSRSTRARSPSRSARVRAQANGLGERDQVHRSATRATRWPRPRRVRPGHRRPAAPGADAGRARAGARRVREARRERVPRDDARAASLVFCSCSAAVDLAALTRALAQGRDARERAGDRARAMVPGRRSPGAAAFGEGLYLKALVAHVEAR